MRHIAFLAISCGLMLGMIARSSQAAGEFPLFERRLGAWVLTAYTRADTGPFTHCVLWTRTEEDVFLVFSLSRSGAASFRMAPSSWTAPAGTQEPVSYQVDDNKVLSGQAKALGSGVGVLLPRDTPLFDQLSAGKKLRVEFAGQVRQFDLAGLSAILPELTDCVQQFHDDVVDVLVPPLPATGADMQAALRSTATEAAAWARQIIAEGTMPRVRLLSAEEMAQEGWDGFFRNAAAGWYSSRIVGALAVHHPQQRSLAAIAYASSVPLRKRCDNDYTLRRRGRDDLVVGFHVECRVGSQREGYAAVAFRDKSGFLWLGSFRSAAVGPDDEVGLMAEGLRRAALARLAQQ